MKRPLYGAAVLSATTKTHGIIAIRCLQRGGLLPGQDSNLQALGRGNLQNPLFTNFNTRQFMPTIEMIGIAYELIQSC
jgi:hypothetical protein